MRLGSLQSPQLSSLGPPALAALLSMVDPPGDGCSVHAAHGLLEHGVAASGWCARIERAAVVPLSHPSVLRLTHGTGQVRLHDMLVKSPAIKMQVFARDGYRCVSCNAHAEYFAVERDADNRAHTFFTLQLYARNSLGQTVVMTLDHVLPRARGGSDAIANLQTMCRPCNQAKADRIEPTEGSRPSRPQPSFPVQPCAATGANERSIRRTPRMDPRATAA